MILLFAKGVQWGEEKSNILKIVIIKRFMPMTKSHFSAPDVNKTHVKVNAT